MHLPDITIVNDPYTMYCLRAEDLNLASALNDVSPETKEQLVRIAEGVVASILNWPADVDGHRFIARASYREELTFSRDRRHWQLGRRPANVTSITLDDMLLEPEEVTIHKSTGVIYPSLGGVWPAGARVVAEYDGGFMTPAQTAQGAPEDYGPALPKEIVAAIVRLAQIAYSTYNRDDIGVRSIREVDKDAGEIETTFAALPSTGGQDQEAHRLLASWRRLDLTP